MRGACDNRRVRRIWPVLIGLSLAGCGGGSHIVDPPASTTITITSAGVSPTLLSVSQGARVTFVNSDSRSHNMTSDPHPSHDTCPELNSVGLLQPGESRESGNMVTARACGFHDHDDPPPFGGTNRWTGTITTR